MTRKNWMVLVISILLILSIIKITQIMSNNNSFTQSSLRSWLTYIEVASLIAVASTIIFGGAALLIRQRLDDLEQIDKKRHELEIQQTIVKADSATAIAETARLNQKEAEMKTKQVELELERLKISVMDRVLPSDKVPLISKILRKRKGESISFTALSSDIEAVNYMNQLAKLFKSCGWIVKTHSPILFGVPIPPGIRLSIKSKEYEARAEAVLFCFNELGSIPDYYLVEDLDEELEVIIGPKVRKQPD